MLRANPDAYTKLVELPSNGDKGAAIRAGLTQTTGEYILFQDADLENDTSDYGQPLLPVLKFNADVVMGSRLQPAAGTPPYTRVYYFWHKCGNKLLPLVFNIFNNTTFTDTYSCYLLYRRSLLDADELISNGWEQHAEILCRVTSRTSACYEVPISYSRRTYAEGKKIRGYHLFAICGMIIRRRFAR